MILSVLALSFASLVPGTSARSVGFSLLDPVGGIVAQDESIYSHSALRMARGGDWLTPRLLDRPATYKPPLLYWLSAASMKLFGASGIALRLPSLVSASVTACLVFLWLYRAVSPWAAVTGVVLLLSSPLWRTVAQLNLMDAPLAALTLAAWAAVRLRGWKLAAGVAVGLAILVKGVAGLLPALALAALLGPRVWPVAAVAAGVAAPWFLYQLTANFDWFWHEFVLTELLRWGLNSPQQTSAEPAWLFYGRRALATDPVLFALGAAGLWRARRDRLLIAGLAVLVLAIAAYSYRNITYLVPLFPLLAISAGFLLQRRWGVGVALIAVAIRLWWSPLPWMNVEPPPMARVLQNYCREARPVDLILVGTDDQFHATLLPLHRVRYAFLDSGQTADPSPLDLKGRGIITSVDEYLRQPDRPPPYATVIAYRSADELARLKRDAPADFIEGGVVTRSARSGSPAPSPRQDPGWCESLP